MALHNYTIEISIKYKLCGKNFEQNKRTEQCDLTPLIVGPFLGMMFSVIIDAHSKWPKVEITRNVIWRRYIDQLLASENISDTQDLELVIDIPGLANKNNAENEAFVDIQDQQETLEPIQEMDEVEQPEQRYPIRIRHQPKWLELRI
ncbi:Hypothetical predicted protein [Paramuricea clavata]|uniref:Uncharacterized protein n=1 Tax=Paramuricea clavata TaxID=317549 RepID=A0A6S7FY81_PARCT|nr:Hypothetical predicted protein [Paramuricea clavata]